MIEKEVFTSVDEILIEEVSVILKENGIPFLRKDDGAGSYTNIVLGKSLEMKRIIVNEEDYERAKKLLEVFENSKADSITTESNNKDEEIDKNKMALTTLFKILGLLILVACILICVIIAS